MASRETHPSAPRRRLGPWRMFLLLIAVCLIVFGIYRLYPRIDVALSSAKPSGSPPVRSVSVVVAKARVGDLPIYLEAPGTVTALNTATVRTRVDGEIMTVNYTEGQIVKEGELLVEIDPRPFQVQLLQAQGQLAKDKALLTNANLDVARYQEAGTAATKQQLDTARATVAQQEGLIKTDQGQIDNAQLQLIYCHITAPFTGRIGLRLVDKGNIVHAADVTGLAVITQIEPITVVFSLPQESLPRVLKSLEGGKEALPVEVYDLNGAVHLATGTLAAVDSQIDLTTLTAKYKAVFSNEDHALFPNQAVKARLRIDTLKNAVLIPVAAVQHSPKTAFVYFVKSDNTVEMRPVKTGPIEGNDASVTEGLAAGDVVVTEGVDKLAPGMKVTIP